MKAIDINLRPVHHYLEVRFRAHAFLCVLLTYVTFHLRRTLAPLAFTETTKPPRTDPVAPATCSAAARKKDAPKKNADGESLCGYRELIEHLGTLTRNHMRVVAGAGVEFDLRLRRRRPSGGRSNCWA
jgi:hypothetical protein